MYDTLLQMGRWFGYRPGYEDLCRVWLPAEAIDWYGHISEATDELRAELKKMYRFGRTPKDFGLAVRAHPDSLLVTARNKMRTAAEITRIISLSQQSFESVELSIREETCAANSSRVGEFLRSLRQRVGEPNQHLFRGATREEVAQLLRGFVVPVTEFRFQPQGIADLLDSLTGDVLGDWDVTIPSGEGAKIEIGGMWLQAQQRKMRLEDPPGVLIVSGDRRRVGSRGVEKAGLSDAQIAEACNIAKKAADEDAAAAGKSPPEKLNVADRFYRAVRTRPLLMVHVLEGCPIEGQDWKLPASTSGVVIAIGLSFPRLDDEPADGNNLTDQLAVGLCQLQRGTDAHVVKPLGQAAADAPDVLHGQAGEDFITPAGVRQHPDPVGGVLGQMVGNLGQRFGRPDAHRDGNSRPLEHRGAD